MTRRRKLEIDTVICFILYVVLVIMVILGHNLLDIVYLLVLTFYLIRIYLCRRKKKSFKHA